MIFHFVASAAVEYKAFTVKALYYIGSENVMRREKQNLSLIICEMAIKPISCKSFRASFVRRLWRCEVEWSAVGNGILSSESERMSAKEYERLSKRRAGARRNQRAFCCAICEWVRESGDTRDRGAYVVRSFETCDTSAGKLDFRGQGDWKRGERREWERERERRERREKSAVFRSTNQKEHAKESKVSPEVGAGWVAHLLKVFWGRTLFCWRLIVVKMVVRYITIWSMLMIRRQVILKGRMVGAARLRTNETFVLKKLRDQFSGIVPF